MLLHLECCQYLMYGPAKVSQIEYTHPTYQAPKLQEKQPIIDYY